MKANGREDEVSINVQNSLYYEEEIVINNPLAELNNKRIVDK